MKFLVDMALSPGLSAWLGSHGHDAVHASQLGLDQAPDNIVLQTALSQNRIIVTADLDFPRLLASLRTDGPGLILLRGGNYSEGEALACARRVLAVVGPEELPSSILVVDQNEIRKRRLPV